MKRSRYLVQKTNKYISNVLALKPLHDLSLKILYIIIINDNKIEGLIQKINFHYLSKNF